MRPKNKFHKAIILEGAKFVDNTQEIFEQYQSICLRPAGARFWKADLHIHTPMSRCYKDKGIDLSQILAVARNCGLEMIAITDHNTIDGYRSLLPVLPLDGLTVFPGVEITAPGGYRNIHLLAIFDVGSDPKLIDDLLARIGILYDARGDEKAIANQEAGSIIREVTQLGGVAIASHVDLENGIIGGMRGQQRIRLLQNKDLRAFEIFDSNASLPIDKDELSSQRRVTWIQNSDSHSLNEIGNKWTMIKSDLRTLDGLRLALSDPESRIRTSSIESTFYPRILGVATKGGFLGVEDGGWQLFRFNSNLNCIIGGRGTGKSALIESIRAAIKLMPSAYSQACSQVIRYGIDIVRVYIQLDVSTTLCVELDIFAKCPKCFKLHNDSFVRNVSLLEAVSIQVKVYSQGMVYDMVTKDYDRIGFIDTLSGKMAPKIQALRIEMERLAMKIRRLMEEEWPALDVFRRDELRAIVKELEVVDADAKSLQAGKTVPHPVSQGQKRKKTFWNLIGLFVRALGRDSEALNLVTHPTAKLQDYVKRLDALRNPPKTIPPEKRHSWTHNRYIRLLEDQEFVSLCREVKANIYNALTDLYFGTKEFRQEITGLLSQFLSTERALFSVRSNVVKNLSQNVRQSALRLSLYEDYSRKAYNDFLSNAILKEEDRDYIETVVDRFSPTDLVQIVLNAEIERFQQRVPCSDETAERLFSFVLRRILSIDGFQSFLDMRHPTIDMKLRDGDQYKPLDRLSIGQRCVCFLTLIMLEQTGEKSLIVIDQPEDHLDNSYVFETLVGSLREAKEKRQIILATHSANITVSGDAEQVIAMKSNGHNGWMEDSGSLDKPTIRQHIMAILEGGREAFIVRGEKYGIRLETEGTTFSQRSKVEPTQDE